MKAAIKEKTRGIDFSILILTLILVCFGLVMVYSASYYYAKYAFDTSDYYFEKQLFGALIGLGAMIFFMFFDYRRLKKLAVPGIVVAGVLLAAVLVPGVGRTLNGASRWFYIGGISVQPSEIAKFAMVLFIAAFASKNPKRIKKFFGGVVPVLAVAGVICALILVQPNLSMVINIALLTFVMLVVAGMRASHGVLLGGAFAAGTIALTIIEPYRMERLLVFLNPWADPGDSGYQLIQSLYAIGAGGLFGVGLGQSRQKLLFLPYRETDFIFAIIVEELGFIGALAVIALFFFLVYRGIRVALTCPDMFGSLLAAGISGAIAIQVLINIGVVTGSIPPTGVALPFFSAGSSSLVIFMSAVGILLNISKSCMPHGKIRRKASAGNTPKHAA
jgi:cell division protein FtsW